MCYHKWGFEPIPKTIQHGIAVYYSMTTVICILGSGNGCPSGYPLLILAVIGDQQGQLLVGLVPGVPHSQASALEVWPGLDHHLCPGWQFDV